MRTELDLSENIIYVADKKAEDCFLYMKLFVNILKEMNSRKQIDIVLESFSINLNDVYKNVVSHIQQMNKNDWELKFKTLFIFTCTYWPLILMKLQGLDYDALTESQRWKRRRIVLYERRHLEEYSRTHWH